MLKSSSRRTRVICLLLAVAIPTVSASSCSTGSYSATRAYSRWIISQGIVLRVLLYLVIGWVTLFTELADVLVLNTIDFWSGKSNMLPDQSFERDGFQVSARHEMLPLKKSTYRITSKTDGSTRTIVFQETSNHGVEVIQDEKVMASAEAGQGDEIRIRNPKGETLSTTLAALKSSISPQAWVAAR